MDDQFQEDATLANCLTHGDGVADAFENAIDGRLNFGIDRHCRWFSDGRQGLVLRPHSIGRKKKQREGLQERCHFFKSLC